MKKLLSRLVVGHVVMSAALLPGQLCAGEVARLFVIFGADIEAARNMPDSKWITLEELPYAGNTVPDYDGMLLTRTGIIVTAHRNLLDRLLPPMQNYMLDGKPVTRAELDAVSVDELMMVTIAGPTLWVTTRPEGMTRNIAVDVVSEAETAAFWKERH